MAAGFLTKVCFYPLRGRDPGIFLPCRAGFAFSQSYLFCSMGRCPKLSLPFGQGAMDMVFLLPAPVAAWAGFCLLLSGNGKVQKIAGGPCGLLSPIATLCNQVNLSPLLSGQKWQNPLGETPGPKVCVTSLK